MPTVFKVPECDLDPRVGEVSQYHGQGPEFH